MRMLRDITDINAFMTAIHQCKDDVWMYSMDKREQFNLKSVLSEYIAIGKLLEDHGDWYEIFCNDHLDEQYLMKFFADKQARDQNR